MTFHTKQWKVVSLLTSIRSEYYTSALTGILSRPPKWQIKVDSRYVTCSDFCVCTMSRCDQSKRHLYF